MVILDTKYFARYFLRLQGRLTSDCFVAMCYLFCNAWCWGTQIVSNHRCCLVFFFFLYLSRDVFVISRCVCVCLPCSKVVSSLRFKFRVKEKTLLSVESAVWELFSFVCRDFKNLGVVDCSYLLCLFSSSCCGGIFIYLLPPAVRQIVNLRPFRICKKKNKNV